MVKIDSSTFYYAWSLVLQTMPSDRASNWSITINNPTDDDVKCVLPGWKLEGQYEMGAEGTRHFQGLLKTPQVRFSAVKRAFPRAHIEIAKNVAALQAYVHKDETRVGEFAAISTPNIFQLQDTVADAWDDEEYKEFFESLADKYKPNAILMFVDKLVIRLIKQGIRGIEFTAINPMWRTSWKIFGTSILARRQTVRQTEKEPYVDPIAAIECEHSEDEDAIEEALHSIAIHQAEEEYQRELDTAFDSDDQIPYE